MLKVTEVMELSRFQGIENPRIAAFLAAETHFSDLRSSGLLYPSLPLFFPLQTEG